MTSNEQCRLEGYKGNYLHQVKHRCPEQYKWMRKNGIEAYRSYTETLRVQMGKMYWEIKESPSMSISELYRGYLSNYWTSISSLDVYINAMAFKSRRSMTPYKTMIKMEIILKKYEEYKRKVE